MEIGIKYALSELLCYPTKLCYHLGTKEILCVIRNYVLTRLRVNELPLYEVTLPLLQTSSWWSIKRVKSRVFVQLLCYKVW